MSEFNEQEKSGGVSRRTVTKAMAWAVPAIAIAAPVPAFAGASQGTIQLTGQNCKLPGNSVGAFSDGAVFLMTITNTTAQPVTISITSVVRGSATQSGAQVNVVKVGPGNQTGCCTLLSTTFTVGANSSGTYALITSDWGNSASNDVSVNYTLQVGANPAVPQPPATGTAGGLPPMGFNNTSCGQNTGSCTFSEARQRCILDAFPEFTCTPACTNS
jgi:hypothetical protein